MTKTTMIRVNTEDLEKMRNECKEALINSEPILEKMTLSDAFMFHRLVRYYTK